MCDGDQDARIGQIVTALVSLGRLLDPADMEDMLGAICVEVDTGWEIVLERRMTRRADGNVVAFPGRRDQAPNGPPG